MENDWVEDRKLVLSELETAKENDKEIFKTLGDIRVQIGVLNAKQVIYGAIGSAVMFAVLKLITG